MLTELSGLFLGDLPGVDCRLDALRLDGPNFPRCERLPQKGEISERRHRLDAVPGKKFTGCVKIELALEVVHTRLQERFAMQSAPEPHGAETATRLQPFVGKITGNFVRRHIYVREDDEPRLCLFEHLSSPAGLLAGIEAFAARKTERLQHLDEQVEAVATGAEGVVVVIGPAEPQLLLEGVLNTGCVIATHPVGAFGGEKQVAGSRGAQVVDRGLDNLSGMGKAFTANGEVSSARSKGLSMRVRRANLLLCFVRTFEATPTVTFHGHECHVIVTRNFDAAQGAAGPSNNVRWIRRKLSAERVDVVDSEKQSVACAAAPRLGKSDRRENAKVILPDVACFIDGLEPRGDKLGRLQPPSRIERQDDRVDPIDEPRSALLAKPLAKRMNLGIGPAKVVNLRGDEPGSHRLWLPNKSPLCIGGIAFHQVHHQRRELPTVAQPISAKALVTIRGREPRTDRTTAL
ncbi:MAG: hypothetical protein KDA63_11470 [Planctomycetales bacterium]|nr:hypothetical protein [Planctomycetales bacterium]